MRDASDVLMSSRLRARGRALRAPEAAPASRAIATVVGLMIAAAALLGLRQTIVRHVPQLAGVYAAIGAPVDLVGLDLRALRSRILLEGERKVLSVEGEIVNLRRAATHVPPVLVTVRGEDGRDRYAWTTRAQKTRLEPGERIVFRARLVTPPTDGVDVLARFAPGEPPAQKGAPARLGGKASPEAGGAGARHVL